MKEKVIKIVLAFIVLIIIILSIIFLFRISDDKGISNNHNADVFQPNAYTEISSTEIVNEIKKLNILETSSAAILDSIHETEYQEYESDIKDLAILKIKNGEILIIKAKTEDGTIKISNKVEEQGLNYKNSVSGSFYKYVYYIGLESAEKVEEVRKEIFRLVVDDEEWLKIHVFGED